MKKIIFLSFIGLLFSYGFTLVQQTPDTVDKNSLTASSRKKMEPYKYDSQKFTRIIFGKKAQHMEVEIPVFAGENYRVVFNTTALPEQPSVVITIYTKSIESGGKREPIFTNKSVPAGTKEMVFDAPRLRKMFIDYEIPASDVQASGYILCLIGYK